MISLRTDGVVVPVECIDQLQQEFSANHAVRLSQLLHTSILAIIQPRLEMGNWTRRVHSGIGTEAVCVDDVALGVLQFATNSPEFLEAVRRISGCKEITYFGGRIYRFEPGTDHHDSWHDDVADGRLVGMSINLSAHVFQGGLFEMRERASGAVFFRVANTGLGDATLFRIAPEIQHRVTDVTGTHARAAFAGWFRAGAADLLTKLKRLKRDSAARGHVL